jgi:hypothetical protein
VFGGPYPVAVPTRLAAVLNGHATVFWIESGLRALLLVSFTMVAFESEATFAVVQHSLWTFLPPRQRR